jgi:hypothetical protein
MKIVSRWIAPLVFAVMLSGPAFGAAGLPVATRPVAAQTSSAPARVETSTTTTADTQSYAQREKQAAGLENFQGGASASIYLGGSALALALLLVILLVLL